MGKLHLQQSVSEGNNLALNRRTNPPSAAPKIKGGIPDFVPMTNQVGEQKVDYVELRA